MKNRYTLKNKKRFALFLGLVILIAITPVFANTVNGFMEPRYQTIVINSGDTLWEIAKSHKGNMDIREYIYEVRKINKLASSEIFADCELKIPVE